MWISREEWDALQRRISGLEDLVAANERKNEFVVEPGRFYSHIGIIGRKAIPLDEAIRHLANHIGAKFQKVEGTPETVIVVKEKK